MLEMICRRGFGSSSMRSQSMSFIAHCSQQEVGLEGVSFLKGRARSTEKMKYVFPTFFRRRHIQFPIDYVSISRDAIKMV